MRSIQFISVALMITSFFGELASQPALPHQNGSLPNGSLPPGPSPNSSIPNGTQDPTIVPREVLMAVRQHVVPSEEYGPLPPEEAEERQHLGELASGPGVIVEPTEVYRLQATIQVGQSETVNAVHCEAPEGRFLLRKLPDGNYSKIMYGVLLPEEPVDN